MVYLLLDCDEYLGAQRLAKLSAALGDPEMAGLNTTELAGGKTSAAEILGHAAMMPFLTPRRLVTVYMAISATWTSAWLPARIRSSAAHAEPLRCWRACLMRRNLATWSLWTAAWISGAGCGAASRSTRPATRRRGLCLGWMALVKTKAVQMEDAGTPDAKALPSWIQRRARERKIAIDGRAVQQSGELRGTESAPA